MMMYVQHKMPLFLVFTLVVVLIVGVFVLSLLLSFWNKPVVTVYSDCDFLGKTKTLGSGTHELTFPIRSLSVPRGCSVDGENVKIGLHDVALGQTIKRRCLPEKNGNRISVSCFRRI